ncbi:hypothetical protein PBRA_002101 [Plasmodiophora brassicae]|uniref:Endonuclease/exonuclease/phosphatase domain-containing protein n=1 Tax=Plasmodiophora brassicae TaxID=37360 RepID=A0A0G4J294_PLABS|nr:hypothetical protein PBRA_002101 [Plasmodiophora brassicae]
MNKEGLPVILTGDFNNDSEEATEVEAVKRHHLLDTFRVVHPDAFAYSYHAFRGRPESCKAGFVIDRAKHHNGYPSDHFPVTAIVDI